jgi:hypothetical protein
VGDDEEERWERGGGEVKETYRVYREELEWWVMRYTQSASQHR